MSFHWRFLRKGLLPSSLHISRWRNPLLQSLSSAPGNSVTYDSGAVRSHPIGLYRLLSAQDRDFLAEQRQLVAECKDLASQVFAGADTRTTVLSQLETSRFLNLESTYSVVVAGEFNAGKSSLINALLGQRKLESGALPTTDCITVVAAADSMEGSLPRGVVWQTIPDSPLLEDLTLIDTPGTNSTWLEHTDRTLRLLPSADLILFVTSADRPFTDSERTLLKAIQEYRKTIIIVVNKMDILEADGGEHGKDSKQAVFDFVMERSIELLGIRPMVIPISARQALSAKLMARTNDPSHSSVWHRSQFGLLEDFLKSSLTSRAKIRSKLCNPIGVSEGVMKQCTKFLHDLHAELQSDIATLAVIESQFEGWRKELAADLLVFQQGTSNALRSQGELPTLLLRRMSVSNFYHSLLIDRTRFDEEWNKVELVLASCGPEQVKENILATVHETAEAVATRSRAQGQSVIEYLGTRPAMKNQSLIGKVTGASRFEDIRKSLTERLSSAVNATLRTSEEMEKEEVFSTLRHTAALSAGLQLGAVVSASAAYLSVVDPYPGIVFAFSLALSSGASYLVGTSRFTRTYRMKWSDRAEHLEAALVMICAHELERVDRRVLDGVGPYTRYVDSEQDRISTLRERCEGLATALHNLRHRISKLS